MKNDNYNNNSVYTHLIMFIIGGEVYEDEEIFKFDPYYNKEIDYNNDDFVYDDEYDLMAVAIENTFSAVIKISV
jgi:hypothetical protein